MLELYGLESRELDRGSRHIRPRRLPEMKPVDSIRFENSADASSNGLLKVPAFIYRETYEPALGSQVLARYVSTGEPAVIEHSYGRGKTVSSGALMGLAYMAPAIQPTSKVLPTNFPASIRDFISLLPRSASVTVPVTTSDPLIEAQYMVGPEGNIVILTNWHETPHDAIIVRFPGIPEVNRVRSLRGAGYFQGHLHEQDMGDLEISVVNGVPEVTLPLGIIDYLIID